MEKKKDVKATIKWLADYDPLAHWENPWWQVSPDWYAPAQGTPPASFEINLFGEGGDTFPFFNTFQHNTDNYEIVVFSAGVKKEFVQVSLEKNGLVVTYLANCLKGHKEYKKTFNVVNVDDVDAKYEDGLLTIVVRKQKEKVKNITIK